jgi:hypothetical protein
MARVIGVECMFCTDDELCDAHRPKVKAVTARKPRAPKVEATPAPVTAPETHTDLGSTVDPIAARMRARAAQWSPPGATYNGAVSPVAASAAPVAQNDTVRAGAVDPRAAAEANAVHLITTKLGGTRQ